MMIRIGSNGMIRRPSENRWTISSIQPPYHPEMAPRMVWMRTMTRAATVPKAKVVKSQRVLALQDLRPAKVQHVLARDGEQGHLRLDVGPRVWLVRGSCLRCIVTQGPVADGLCGVLRRAGLGEGILIWCRSADFKPPIEERHRFPVWSNPRHIQVRRGIRGERCPGPERQLRGEFIRRVGECLTKHDEGQVELR